MNIYETQYLSNSKNMIRYISVVALLLIISISVFANNPVKMIVEPEEATVGDVVNIQITVPGETFESVEWPVIEDGKLGDFHVLAIDTANAKAEKKLGGATITYAVAAYDTGNASTGELNLSTESGLKTVLSGSVLISTILNDSTGTEFNPLKAQEDLPVTFRDILRWVGPWAIGLLVLAIIAHFLYHYWWKKRNQNGEGDGWITPAVPPYDEAVRALAHLKKNNPLQRGDQKGYVSELSLILKRLLERVHQDPVLEMTTGEVRKWSQKSDMHCEPATIIEVLEPGDYVKFAKQTLDGPTCDRMFQLTENIVVAYKPEEKEDVEKGIEVASPPEKVEEATS
jgi:hypothetical protein